MSRAHGRNSAARLILPPCVAEYDAESVTDDDRQPHNTREKENMKLTKEQKHRDRVRQMSALLDDENADHMKHLTVEFQAARNGLRLAIHHLTRLDGLTLDEGGYNELVMELSQMLGALRSDEIAVLELCGAMNTESEMQS